MSDYKSPSFDCRSARRSDEQAVCSDLSLSRLDVIYSSNFEKARLQSGFRAVAVARSFNRNRAACRYDRDCVRKNLVDGFNALRELGGRTDIPRDLLALSVAPVSPFNQPPATNSSTVQTTQVIVQSPNAEALDLRGKVEQLTALVRDNAEKKASATQLEQVRSEGEQESIPAINEDALGGIIERFDRATVHRTSYQTPTTPDDQNLGSTPRLMSEKFPKVPFYIPGTLESGRFWIEPRVSDSGTLHYNMVFVEPNASVDRRRAVIDLSPEQLERMKSSILKLSQWSSIAHQNEIHRSYRKRVDCFPETACPREGEKIEGKSSTEIVFIVNEDGSTAGRIQRNKGRYDEGYNISIKSARLLASYLGYVQSRAQRDYEAGMRTMSDLDLMFK